MRIPRITDFEHRRQQVISRRRFAGRMLKAVGLWLLLAVVGLVIGMAGYAEFEDLSRTDAYVNAAMILSGMGPLGELKTTVGKRGQFARADREDGRESGRVDPAWAGGSVGQSSGRSHSRHWLRVPPKDWRRRR